MCVVRSGVGSLFHVLLSVVCVQFQCWISGVTARLSIVCYGQSVCGFVSIGKTPNIHDSRYMVLLRCGAVWRWEDFFLQASEASANGSSPGGRNRPCAGDRLVLKHVTGAAWVISLIMCSGGDTH